MKVLVLKIHKKELRWDFFRGSGKGGQKRNKTENCARCYHQPSKAIATSEESRSKTQNIKLALSKIIKTKNFKDWIDSLFTEKHIININLVDDTIYIYDLGKYIPPKRKEIKRKPTLKDKNKIERANSKKLIKDY